MFSENLIERDTLALRRMRDTADDYTRLAAWLTDPCVLEYYEGRDNPYALERVRAKYHARVCGQHATVPCLMLLAGIPIGYLQYYRLTATDKQAFDLPDTAQAYGMDLFIGEPAYWNRGLGTTLVGLARQYLCGQLDATHITLDPRVENVRAIRCYAKCGFRTVKMLARHEHHEGVDCDCWLMLYERSVASGP